MVVGGSSGCFRPGRRWSMRMSLPMEVHGLVMTKSRFVHFLAWRVLQLVSGCLIISGRDYKTTGDKTISITVSFRSIIDSQVRRKIRGKIYMKYIFFNTEIYPIIKKVFIDRWTIIQFTVYNLSINDSLRRNLLFKFTLQDNKKKKKSNLARESNEAHLLTMYTSYNTDNGVTKVSRTHR